MILDDRMGLAVDEGKPRASGDDPILIAIDVEADQ